MPNYLCVINEAGPANSGATSNPNVNVNLTDMGGSFANTWFYAADGIQDQILDVGIAAIIRGELVDVTADAPNAGGSPYTQITRMLHSRLVAPTGLHLIGVSGMSGASNTDVKLGWTAVPAPGGANDIVYQITFSDGASSGSTISNTNDALLNLTAGNTYTVYVQASYSDSTTGVPNTLSAPSNSIVVSTPPQRTVIATNVTGSTGGSPSEITVTVQGSGFAPNSVVVVHITPTNSTTGIQISTTVGAEGTFENSIAIQCIVGIALAVIATVDNDPTYVLSVPPPLTC